MKMHLDFATRDLTSSVAFYSTLLDFVCRHDTARSQMAEAYLRHSMGIAVDVASACCY